MNRILCDVDQQRTKAIFGHPDGGFLLRTGPRAQGPLHLYERFRPIGAEVDILRYRGVTYFDSFFTKYQLGDFHDTRRNDKRWRDTLGVFVHTAQRTQQVCEYYVKDQGD